MNRRLIILLGLMIVLVAAVVISYGADEKPAFEEADQKLLFPDLQNQVNDITKIELTQGKVRTTVMRDKDGVWRVKEKSDYVANRKMVRSLISAYSRTYLMEARTAKKENYKALGLDDAFVRKVNIYTSGEEPVATLYVGLQKAARGATFVHRPDEDQTWLAKDNLAFEASPDDWLQKDLLAIPDVEIKSVTVTHSDAPEVKIFRDKPGGDVKLANIPAGKSVKDPVILSGQFSIFSLFRIDDVRPASELRTSSVESARVITFDGRDILFRLNKDGDTLWVTVEATYHPEMTPEGEKAALAKKFIEGFSKQIEGYAFRLPSLEEDKLIIKMSDLIK